MLAAKDAIGGALAIDEAAVERLDASARTRGIDEALLGMTPVRDLRSRIEAVVSLLERMDPARLLRKQGPIARLVGADIEARLQFELSSEQVLAATGQLKTATQNGRHLRTLLDAAGREIAADQIRFEAAITEGKERLAHATGTDPFILSRFERRLANIMAMHAANLLTIGQLAITREVLTALLDRCTDVETMLLPVWHRYVLALASSSGSGLKRAGKDFTEVHTNLIEFLKEGLQQ